MTTRSWIRRLFNRKPRTIRKPPARIRPVLEALEERTLFSVTPTALSLGVASTALVYGQSEALTATVTTPSGAATPTASDGTVTFSDGTTVLGTATLSGSPATATLTTTSLAAGTHTITASYSGDGDFAASQSGVEPTSTQTIVAAGLSSPTDVAVDGQGNVFIADLGNHRVLGVTPNGTLFPVGSGFFDPSQVAVDGQGDVFIYDQVIGVWVVTPPDYVSQFPAGGGPFQTLGEAQDGQGDQFLADTAHNQVLELKADGSPPITVGSGLNQPVGVAVDGQGDVFIADTGNNRVVEVTAGLPVTVSPAPLTVTADNQVKIAGQANPAFTVSYNGFVNGDGPASLGGTLTFSTPATVSSPVGAYDLTPSGLTSANYAITFAPGTLFVVSSAPGAITIQPLLNQNTSEGKTVSIGVAAAATGGQAITYSATGLPAGVSIDPNTGTISGTLVGGDAALAPRVVRAPAALHINAGIGYYTITVTASDGLVSASTSFDWGIWGSILNGGLIISPSDQGEYYDVDNDWTDGAEDEDSPQGNHTQAAAANLPEAQRGEAVETFQGVILSDSHPHTNPSVIGFNLPTGSAPDWYQVFVPNPPGLSNEVDDLTARITTWGGIGQYALTIYTSTGALFSTTVSGNGTSTVSTGPYTSGGLTGYTDNSEIYFEISSKTSLGNVPSGAVNYVVTFQTTNGFSLPPGPTYTSTTVTMPARAWFYGQPQTFTAQVVGSPSNVVPTGSVQFQVDGINFGQPVALDANRMAEFTTMSLAPGMHDIEAVYTSNNPNIESSSGDLSGAVTVTTDPTTISVSVTPTKLELFSLDQPPSSAAVVYGRSETITATVVPPIGQAIPGASDGTVNFYDGTTLLGTATLSGNPATATLVTTALTAGPQEISAVYSGDGSFQPSNLASTPVTVTIPTSTSVSASSPATVYGQSETFTATVTGPSGAPIPGPGYGIVTFYDGATVLGTATLSGNPATATLTTTALAAGSHAIIAVYSGIDSGDNRFAASRSAGVPSVLPGSGHFYPWGLAVDGQGDVFIADPSNSQVLKVQPDGTQTSVDLGLEYPWNVAVDQGGNVFIADRLLKQVLKVQPDGTQTQVGSGFSEPFGLAVDNNGNVFIGDEENGSVVKVTDDGDGTQTTVISGLSAPDGLAVDKAGDLFIADAGAGDVIEVQPNGTQRVIVSGLFNPMGVALDNAGDLFIVDTGDPNDPLDVPPQVLEVLADGTQPTFGSGLNYPALTYPSGVAVDGMGDVFIADQGVGHIPPQVVEVANLSVTVSQATPTVSINPVNIPYGTALANGQLSGTAAGTVGGNPVAVAGTFTYTSAAGTVLNLGDGQSETVTFTPDDASDYSAVSTTVTVNVARPTASITGPTIGVPGQPLTFTFAVNGPTQGVVFTIDYGDGTNFTTSAGGPSVKLDHTYTATGGFTIQVAALDTGGVAIQSATQQVQISTVALEADPTGGTALAVGGSAAGGNTILVSAVDATGKTLSVTVNKTPLGTFTPTGHLFVYGQGGRDTITLKAFTAKQVNHYIQVPAFLYGEGPGGDRISAAGSAADNVLTGHGKGEILTAGRGRDLLIGGTGTATVNAGIGDDILFGGWTSYDLSSSGITYDQKLAALDAIMTEWGSTDSYATRLSALASYLSTNTVHASSVNGVPVSDRLTGNARASDWFFAGVKDLMTGKNKSDVITTIR